MDARAAGRRTGAATGFFSPASTGLLPEVVLTEQLQPANGLRASAVSTGEILGPVVAGVLVAAAGAGWAIAVDAVTFAVSAACLAMLRVPTRVAARTSSLVADLREGWVAFRSRRWVWTFVVYFAIVNVLWGAWGALGPIVAERDLGGAAAWGTILAAMGSERWPAACSRRTSNRAGRCSSPPSPTGSSRCRWPSWPRPHRCH